VLGMKGAVLAGETLADHLCVLVDENGHGFAFEVNGTSGTGCKRERGAASAANRPVPP
jgi:hypothetical protein